METTEVTKKRLPEKERKLSILKALADLLMTVNGPVTTKALANKLEISEAALYRHFPSKTKIYDELISYTQTYFQGGVNKIRSQPISGLEQAEQICLFLISVIQSNPAIVILYTGDALGAEKDRLKQSINNVFDSFQSNIKQALGTAILQKLVPESYDINLRANLLVALVLGHWVRFSRGDNFGMPVNFRKQIQLILTAT